MTQPLLSPLAHDAGERTLALGRETLSIEAQAVAQLVGRVGPGFVKAVHAMLNVQGRVVVMGMGKSGHIGRKIAATLASTGTPASARCARSVVPVEPACVAPESADRSRPHAPIPRVTSPPSAALSTARREVVDPLSSNRSVAGISRRLRRCVEPRVSGLNRLVRTAAPRCNEQQRRAAVGRASDCRSTPGRGTIDVRPG